jgi:Holliday junction resolvase
MGRAGIPDIICCARGRFLAIECKAGKGTTTALQEKELAAIRAAGGVALVINESNLTLLGDTIKELLS